MSEEEMIAANEMRLTFNVQIDELIDLARHYEAKMELSGDEEEAARIRGAIAYARKVTDKYKYNGPYKPLLRSIVYGE